MTLRLSSRRGTRALFALVAIGMLACFFACWRASLHAGVLLCMLACFFITQPSKAQDGGHGHGHAENHNMYEDWKRPDVGGSCCNAQSADDPDGDCRPTTAYIGDDGRWRARIKPGSSGFVVVPANKILNRAADGRCHICERLGAVFCFQPCDPKS